MTPLAAASVFVSGVLLAVVGLFLLFGPWALVAAGLLIATAALLVPTREAVKPADGSEPALPVVPPQ